MSHAFQGERTLMRIFVGERDKCRGGEFEGEPLYQALVDYLRSRELPGVTVIRGIEGFGAHTRVHTDRVLRLSLDLPIVVEVVASDGDLRAMLPDLDRMIDGGLVTMEPVRVVLFRPHDIPEDERWKHRIEGLDEVAP